MSPRATSTQLLNPSRDGDSTTPLGSVVQSFTALLVKKFFLISDLNTRTFSPRPVERRKPPPQHHSSVFRALCCPLPPSHTILPVLWPICTCSANTRAKHTWDSWGASLWHPCRTPTSLCCYWSDSLTAPS